jgi:heme exporter protein A
VTGGHLLAFEQAACIRGGRLLFEAMDFALGPGDAMTVTGPNGAGKSSLLRLAAGLLRPTAGRVDRAVPQSLADDALALDPRLSLAAALGFWARLDGHDPSDAMEAMGLAELSSVPARMLSSGQRKRASLARVIASGARLWLLDEPANALDEEGLVLLAGAMAAHRGSGGAILAASHQPLPLPDANQLALGSP